MGALRDDSPENEAVSISRAEESALVFLERIGSPTFINDRIVSAMNYLASGRALCMVGWHRWELGSYSRLIWRDCRRCGRHERDIL